MGIAGLPLLFILYRAERLVFAERGGSCLLQGTVALKVSSENVFLFTAVFNCVFCVIACQ